MNHHKAWTKKKKKNQFMRERSCMCTHMHTQSHTHPTSHTCIWILSLTHTYTLQNWLLQQSVQITLNTYTKWEKRCSCKATEAGVFYSYPVKEPWPTGFRWFLHHQYVIQRMQFLSCSKQTLLNQSAACIMMLNNSRPHKLQGENSKKKRKGNPKVVCIYITIIKESLLFFI